MKRRLELVRTASFYGSDRREEVIFDFDDNWHCAMKFKIGITAGEVADELRRLADLIERAPDGRGA